MTTANINVRVDAELKKEAEGLFNDLGLNMSSAITMFLKSAVRCDGIPFQVRRNAFNAETRAALAEYEEMKTHPEKAMHMAVEGMLQDNALARAQIVRLRTVVGSTHKHEAQKPDLWTDMGGNK